MQQPQLKQGSIYSLPNGTEVIVGVGRKGRYFLYHSSVWKSKALIIRMPIEYEVDAQGRILTAEGQPTTWNIEDLSDTSHTVERER